MLARTQVEAEGSTGAKLRLAGPWRSGFASLLRPEVVLFWPLERVRLLAMGLIERRLDELGLTLPAPLVPPGNFQLVKVHDGLAYIAGHGPFDGSTPLVQGLVGRDLDVDEAYRAARLTALSILASLKREFAELDRVTEWIRAVGYVHCQSGFGQNATVVNGFSDLIVELWGDAGRHARSAPGQGPSPLNVPIIVDAVVAVS
jgi:enamine deaminase RidA (YjgF/YER057c/UK114 family)